MDDGVSMVFGLVMFFAALGLYFLPAIVAEHRGRDSSLIIGIANLLLGWTVIAWVVLLVIAFTGESSEVRKHREEELALLRKLADDRSGQSG